jgi:hypothetical protein
MKYNSLFLLGLILLSACSLSSKTVVLENDRLKAEFDVKNGALVRFVNKETGWNIVNRPILGQSFELLLPLTDIDIRYNVIAGNEQKAPNIEQNANRLTFTWKNLRNDRMKTAVDVTFKGTVSLTETGLEYAGEVTNNSPYPVEYVSWPYLGEVTVPDKQQPFYCTTRTDTRELFPHFSGQHGYWGVDYFTMTPWLPYHTFVLANNKEQGLVVYGEEKYPDNLLINTFELIPGFDLRTTNPYTDEMDGQLVRIQFKSNRVIYNQPGEQTVLTPVYLSVYKGSWHKGTDIYKATKDMSTIGSPDWMGEPLVWQKIGIANGNDLSNYAREAVTAGVDVLQVRGWYRVNNGQLEEVPNMADAIDASRKQGLRIVLETNWTSVENAAFFNDLLADYVIKDPYGIPYDRTLLCPLPEIVQQKIADEWMKLKSLTLADGVINTDIKGRTQPYHCFVSGHGHKEGESVANGIMQLDEKMAALIKSHGQKVVMGFGFYDGQNTIYDGYQITTGAQHFPKQRYLNPAVPVVATVDVRNARNDMNQAVLNRFNFSYDLRFYNNHIKDYPHIISYGKSLKSFTERFRSYIWDAVATSPDDIEVEGDNLSYSVYVNKENGKKAIIVVNTSNDRSSQVKINPATERFYYASPEKSELQAYEGNVDLPPLSILIYIQQ